MSPCTLKPVACRVPPVTLANGSDPKPSKVDVHSRKSLPFLQMKDKDKGSLQEIRLSTSRREMMHFTAASLGLLSLTLPLNAEASPRNATMRQKIMDKLEKLRQKAGLSKPKDETEEDKPKDEDKDRKLTSEDKGKNPSEEKKTKVEEQVKKAELKNGTNEEKSSQTESSSKVPLQEHPLIPSLPNILNDKTIESNLP